MGQATPLHRTALVVEDDETQRTLVSALLEEGDLSIIECDSAEAALAALDHVGSTLTLIFTDVRLAGEMDGFALAQIAVRRFPHVRVIVTSGVEGPARDLPSGAVFMQKPWRALDILREMERSVVGWH